MAVLLAGGINYDTARHCATVKLKQQIIIFSILLVGDGRSVERENKAFT